MWIYNRIEKLGARYNKSLQNCMHASFLVASDLLIPAQHNILLCTFQYETKSHMVAAKNKLYFEFSEKFTFRRGRINCSLNDEIGWRWLGLQFSIKQN